MPAMLVVPALFAGALISSAGFIAPPSAAMLIPAPPAGYSPCQHSDGFIMNVADEVGERVAVRKAVASLQRFQPAAFVAPLWCTLEGAGVWI